jgi:hypothetical protein
MENIHETPKKLKLILINSNKKCLGKNCPSAIRKPGSKYVCEHNNLTVTHPELSKEWDYEKNEHPPSYYTFGANTKVAWICPDDPCGCHRYEATINNRSNGRGCKFCNSNIACAHNNLLVTNSDLCKEWDYEKNEKGPENYTYGSGVKVHWVCPLNPCGCHKYEASIKSRTSMMSGCKFCNSGAACNHNNLTITHKELCREWDYERNKQGPEEYTYGSDVKIHWICPNNPCGCHRYISPISARTASRAVGCKYCNKGYPCLHNNLSTTHPEICKDWDYSKNKQGPENYTHGSNEIIFWSCNNNHSYKAPIYYRTYYKTSHLGCPSCTPVQYSKISIKWINSISEKENIYIQCAANDREYKIEGIGKVDGYCEETNTVYEFHGDFWHGNPLVFKPNDINPLSKKQYGELYNKTVERDQLILLKGYNLVTMWEYDYNEMKKNPT